MLSELFFSAADAVLSYVLEKLDPVDRLKTWLKRDPAKLAFQKALARTYSAFARQYPEYAASFFDPTFLAKDAVPIIAELLTRNRYPDPALLAQAWGKCLGFDADAAFCRDATKPAADFVKWLEAELKAEPAFQALFDSRALDSLPRMEAEIKQLTNLLTQSLGAAVRAANGYEAITLSANGDDSSFIQGDVNQVNVSRTYNYFYSGAFASLDDYYIRPDAVFQRVRLDEFTGRDWLTAKLDSFLDDPHRKSGAFLVRGEAGVGKTAFMAHLVRERRYLHLFAEQVPGDANVQRALQSLGSQLVTRYQLDPYKDRDTLTQLAAFPDFLERLLRLAARTLSAEEKIVIVCDALDEAGTFPDGYAFGLPSTLPDGVYFILSQRPVNTKLPNIVLQVEALDAQSKSNLDDMRAYLNRLATRPQVAGQLRSRQYSEAFFAKTLMDRSLGVWMYLHYVIQEIENGLRAPLDLENLPTGLVGYYADYWDDWRNGRRGRGGGPDKWDELYAPLLATLAAVQEPIGTERLIEWASVTAKPSEVNRLLNDSWRSFVNVQDREGHPAFSPYHLSFREFILGKVDYGNLSPAQENLVHDLAAETIEAHRRILKQFEEQCQGDWERLALQEYPRLHLTTHMDGARDYANLRRLVTEGRRTVAWAEARFKQEETYAGYLSDLQYAWKYAENEWDFALLIRCMLIENSIHSLASNIPPVLIAELGLTGLWSYVRCLKTIDQKPSSSEQVESLKSIAAAIPKVLMPDALAAACKIQEESDRERALAALAPHLTDELKPLALTAAREIQDEYYRAGALAALAPHLTDELKPLALAAAREMHSEYCRATALIALAPHLTDELKLLALTAAREIQEEYHRARALTALAPDLADDLRRSVLQEALDASRAIRDESGRARTLRALAPSLADDLKPVILQEALAAARAVQNKSDRVSALAKLVSYVRDDLKASVLKEAIAASREIQDNYWQALSLATLAPSLADDLKVQILVVIRAIKIEANRAPALAALAPHLTDELKPLALAAAREMHSEYCRATALIALAPYVTGDLKPLVLNEALGACRAVQGEYVRSSLLTDLVPALTDDLKPLALVAAREIRREIYKARALASLAPSLADDLKRSVLQEALAASRAIQDEDARASALAALAPYLTDDLKRSVLQQALDAVLAIQDQHDRASALTALVPSLADDLQQSVLQQALDAVLAIQDEVARGTALTDLAPALTADLKPLALAAARQIYNGYSRASTLTALAPSLPDDLKRSVLQEALDACRTIEDEHNRAIMLAALAPYSTDDLKPMILQEALAASHVVDNETGRAITLTRLAPSLADDLKRSVLQQALAASRAIQDDYARASALTELLPYLTDDLKPVILQEAIAASQAIEFRPYRGRALTALAPYRNIEDQQTTLRESLSLTDDLESLLSEWKNINYAGLAGTLPPFLRSCARMPRKEGVRSIAALTPGIIHVTTRDLAGEILRALQDTARWWP